MATYHAVLKLNPVETWLSNVAYSHSQSKSTEISYRQGLSKFLNFIEKTPEQILEDYKNTTDREFKRKYARLVRAFISVQMKGKFAIGSIGTFVSAVRSFFMYNDLPLGHIPVSKGYVTYHNRDITREEITLILGISRPRDRAFFCMMAQTGLRPHTLCQLKLKHIEPELSRKTIPCKLDIPKHIAKGKYRHYFTFMGEESTINLEKYLRKRKETKPDDYLFTKHGSNKPVTPNAMSWCFKNLIDKLREKGDIILERKKEKPAELRLYSLRKYFRKFAGIMADDKYVQFWMGHTLGVDDHYFSRDVELHRKVYAEKAMPYLRLWETTATKTEQAKQIQDLTKRLEEAQLRFDRLNEFMHKWLKDRMTESEQMEMDETIGEDLDYMEKSNEQALRDYERKKRRSKNECD